MGSHAVRQAEHLLLIPQHYRPRTQFEEAATKARRSAVRQGLSVMVSGLWACEVGAISPGSPSRRRWVLAIHLELVRCVLSTERCISRRVLASTEATSWA